MRARVAVVTADVAARKSVADRGGLAFTTGFYLAVTLALGALWRTAAAANGGAIATYSAVALTWYVVTSEAVTISLDARLIDQVGEDVRDGTFAVELLRPVPMLAIRVATHVGRALPRLALCATLGVLVATATGGAPPSAAGLALAVPSMVLAIVANLFAMHAFAAAAFWVRDTRSTWFLYQKLVFVLGGMLLPIEVLPGPLAATARALPFTAMAYAPARLASGHVEPYLLAVQAGWVVGLALLAAWVFARGERRLQVVGA